MSRAVPEKNTGKTYSTFVDNTVTSSSTHFHPIDGVPMSRKSSTASLHPSINSSKPLPSATSTTSFQRQYHKPPVVPTTTSPLHHRENFVSGTGNYSSSYFGVFLWKIGSTCCPCFGGSIGGSGDSGSSWQGLARTFVKKLSPGNRAPTEGQQLIKRTKSEEEILKKRPRRKVVSTNQDADKSIPVSRSESVNNISVVDSSLATVPEVPTSSKRTKPQTPTTVIETTSATVAAAAPATPTIATTTTAATGGRRKGSDVSATAAAVVKSSSKSNGSTKPNRPEFESASRPNEKNRLNHREVQNLSGEEKRSQSLTRIKPSSNDNFDQWSNKSGSPSPIISGSRLPHGVVAARDLVRDFRESSVNSRSSADSFGIDPDFREDSVPRDDLHRHPSPFTRHQQQQQQQPQQQFGGSTSSLGSRSESMLSIHSQEGGRYGTVTVRGEVEFGMAYSLHSASLDLAIKQCRDLAAVDSKRNRSDPYVKIYLLPDKSKGGKRKTKVKKHSINPVFDEILKFQMPLDEVERRTLWLSVWHSDMFGRNDFLGEVMLPLIGQPLDDPSPKWYSLSDRTEPLGDEMSHGLTYRGEIIVALKFLPPGVDSSSSRSKTSSTSSLRRSNSSTGGKRGSLLILVKEAKNLVAPRGSGYPDSFVKCYLLPATDRSNKQKTPVCRKTICPRWETTLRWDDISLTELANVCLELTVWDQDRLPGRHSECLGGARFNLGTGKHQGRPVAWMDSGEKEVNLWQQMLDRPNFWVEGSVLLRAPEKVGNSSNVNASAAQN